MSGQPQPDRRASVDFLTWYEPEGPWCLTAIPPEGGPTSTRTFTTADDESAVVNWLDAHGKQNLYFSVNRVRGTPTKKARKDAISEFRWVHVDVDPLPDQPLPAEQERIRALLSADDLSTHGVPPATLVIFSGGGYQAFWRLSDPVAVRDVAHAEGELELHARHLLATFGGDPAAFNVDRIMRLPGTINWPNQKKREKGRTPALARVELRREAAYPLANFPKLVPASPAARAKQAPPTNGAVAPAKWATFESVDTLPAQVPDSLRQVILHGRDPANPQKLPSRSEWAWWATCEMVRVGLSDAEILGITTDPKFAISGHVLDQKHALERYAPRQVQRARDFAVDPLMAEFNERHAVICDVGGKCRIVGEVYDHGLNRARVSLQSFADFANRYCNRKVLVGTKKNEPIYQPAGQWWIHHPSRRQFETMTFAPGKDTPGAFNLWRGFACEAVAGDCEPYLQHVLNVACSGDATTYHYLIHWMAHAVQRPGEAGQVAIVLKGKQGTGKGTIAKHFGSLFGRHFVHVANAEHLIGKFNAHLRDCVILFADEAFYAGDKKHESVLKALVTEDTIVVEKKGIDVEFESNCVHLIMASNEKWVAPVSLGDRRFFVLAVSDAHVRESSYFAALDAHMRNGGREALLHYLMHLDLKDFDIRKRPATEALADEKGYTLGPEHSWWMAKLDDARVFPHAADWQELVVCQELADNFVLTCKKWGGSARSSQVKLGLFLKEVIPGGVVRRRLTRQYSYCDATGMNHVLDRPFAYLLPDLETCREHWRSNIDSNCPEWSHVPDHVETPFSGHPEEAYHS